MSKNTLKLNLVGIDFIISYFVSLVYLIGIYKVESLLDKKCQEKCLSNKYKLLRDNLYILV